MKSELLDILCCPETHQSLQMMSKEDLASLNTKIENKEIKTQGGDLVTDLLEEALIREDHKWVYRVREGIPIMLVDEALVIVQ